VIFQGPSNFSLYSHGVNNAVALKWAAAWSHVYGPPELAEALFDGENGDFTSKKWRFPW